MRKLSVTAICVVLSGIVHAASVPWRTYFSSDPISNGLLSGDGLACYLHVSGGTYESKNLYSAGVIFEVYAIGMTYVMVSRDLEATAADYICNWLKADNGTVVSAANTRNRGNYFNHCKIDHETDWRNTFISGDLGSDLYLMFAAEELHDYDNNVVDPRVMYGWVQLGIDDAGRVSVLQSVQGSEGLVVGAIPEPSNALLLLFGAAALALRRRATARA